MTKTVVKITQLFLKCTTDSMKNYLQRVNRYFKANKVETDLQVSTIMASIRASTYHSLRDIKAPDEAGLKTLDEVSAVVLNISSHTHFKLKLRNPHFLSSAQTIKT